MNRQLYFSVTSIIFLILAVISVLRVVNGWNAAIGELDVPLWASYVGILVGGYLAWYGFQYRK